MWICMSQQNLLSISSIMEAYGVPTAEAFAKQFTADGGVIVSRQTFDVGHLDFRTQLLRIKRENPEVIFLVAFPAEGVAAIKQMKQLGMTQKVIGVSAMDSKDGFLDPLGKLAEGIIISTLTDTSTPGFRARYQREFNREWQGVGTCAAVGYDSVAILGAAFKAVGTDAMDVRSYLSNLRDFPGVSGNITFNLDHDLDREHAIFEVQSGKLQRIVAPP